MTKAEIEKLIDIIDDYVPVHHVVAGSSEELYYRADDLLKVLRDYPVESDKTCGPDYKSMYEHCKAELDKAQRKVESLDWDLRNLSIDRERYIGAVSAMEVIFGRKFEPKE